MTKSKFIPWLAIAVVACACNPCKDCPATCAVRTVQIDGVCVCMPAGSNVCLPSYTPPHTETERYCPVGQAGK